MGPLNCRARTAEGRPRADPNCLRRWPSILTRKSGGGRVGGLGNKPHPPGRSRNARFQAPPAQSRRYSFTHPVWLTHGAGESVGEMAPANGMESFRSLLNRGYRGAPGARCARIIWIEPRPRSRGAATSLDRASRIGCGRSPGAGRASGCGTMNRSRDDAVSRRQTASRL